MVRMLSFVLDKKAQAGIELLIFVGVFLILSITLVPYVLKNNELNIALTCARDGATYGLHVLKLGYSENETVYKYHVKIDKILILDKGKEDNKKKYQIRAVVFADSRVNCSFLQAKLQHYMGTFVADCLGEKYKNWRVETSKRVFTFYVDINGCEQK